MTLNKAFKATKDLKMILNPPFNNLTGIKFLIRLPFEKTYLRIIMSNRRIKEDRLYLTRVEAEYRIL